MHILYLTQYFPPDIGAAATRACEMAHHLTDLGILVDVLTAFPHYPSGLLRAEDRGRLFRTEKFGNLQIFRSYVWASPYKNTLRRLLNYGTFMLSAILASRKLQQHYDVLVATSPPLSVGIAGCVIARMRDIPWILDVRDLIPQAFADMGEISESSISFHWLQYTADKLYQEASRILVTSDTMKHRLVQRQVPAERVEVVYNGVDDDVLPTITSDGKALRVQHGIKDQFVVTCAGLMGYAMDLDMLIEVAAQLQSQPDIMFLFIGDGVEKQRIMAKVKCLGLRNVRFLPPQSRVITRTFLQISNICVIALRSSQQMDIIPFRLLEYLAMGKPVILAAEGESRTLLEKANAGICIGPGDAEKMREGIIAMHRSPALCHQNGESRRLYIQRYFPRKRAAIALAQTLNAILPTHTNLKIMHQHA